MARKQLIFENIKDIDHGRIAIAVNHALRQVYLDIQDRPNLPRERKVGIEISLKPITDGGALVEIEAKFKISAKRPEQSSVAYRMKESRDGMTFQTDAPDNPHQNTLDVDGEGKTATKKAG